MSRILVTGTLAIDYAARYGGRFEDLPRHAGINLSIHLDRIDRRFGGCAMNIVYSLRRLGHDPAPFVFVGDDFDKDYERHLTSLGVDQSGVIRLPGTGLSSHAFIFTDLDGNQFTGFYPGPSRVDGFTDRLTAFVNAHEFDYAVLAPDIAINMIAAAEVMNDLCVPFLCDPGQGMTDFTGEEMAELVGLSRELIVNEFELETLTARSGLNPTDTLDHLLVTAGGAGSRCGKLAVAAVPTSLIKDPTGCGDAFRAGFIDARLRGATMRDALRAGACVATINLEYEGSQTHDFDDYAARYAEAWGAQPDWLATAHGGRPAST